MAEELTIDILDRAIDSIRQFESDRAIIGFKLNPSDLKDIMNQTTVLWCVDNNQITMTPPYQGFTLIPDNDIPPGYPEPIRRVV